MFKKSLALFGLLLILWSAFLGMAWIQYWDATWDKDQGFIPSPAEEELGFWQLAQSILPVSHELLFDISFVALLLGFILTFPWWLERLHRENAWWEKRDTPFDRPPRVP